MKNKEQANKRSRQDIIQINGVFRSFEILYQWDFDTAKMGHFPPLIVQSVHLLSAQIFLLWRKEMASFRAAALCFINRRWGRVRQTHFLGAATQFFFNPKISEDGYIFQCLNFYNEIECILLILGQLCQQPLTITITGDSASSPFMKSDWIYCAMVVRKKIAETSWAAQIGWRGVFGHQITANRFQIT